MHEAFQRFGLDPMLAALYLAFVLGGAYALTALFDRCAGTFRDVVSPASQKVASLEGLRGVLAFSVVAHHAYCWFFFTQTGIWSTGNSIIFARLADFGVIQFFYLSGLLFWRKLIKSSRIPAGRFYLSRLVRIGPVYYACVGAAILLGLFVTGFKLQVSAGSLLASLLPWVLFSLGGQPTVNGADVLRITCGVTWTLALEWLFYLSLPFLGWFARKRWRLVVYALGFGGIFLVSRYLRSGAVASTSLNSAGEMLGVYTKFMLIGFGGGILVAAEESRLKAWVHFIWPWRNFLLAGLYIAYLVIPGIAASGQILVLAAFALVVHGADLWGALVSRAVRLLGVVSYPVYLVHGIVYYAAMRLRGGIHTVGLLAYLVETAACLAAILLLACLLHLLVERPTMRLSEEIARATAVERSVAH